MVLTNRSGRLLAGLAMACLLVVGCQNGLVEDIQALRAQAILTVPGAPTGLSVTATSTTATLSWGQTATATAYHVYWSTTAGVTPATGNQVSTTSNYWTATNLTAGTFYYFVVTAVNSKGESTASAQVNLPITGLTAVWGPASGEATLTWTAVSGASSYNLYYSSSSFTSTTATGVHSVTNVSSPSVVTGLTTGASYYFRLTAVTDSAESALSDMSNPSIPVPGAPTISSIAVGGTSGTATVTWTAPSNISQCGTTTYNIYYATSSAGATTASSTNLKGQTGLSASISGLTNGTLYYFVVTAVDATGESTASSVVSATPVVPASGAPLSLTCSPANASLTLAWAAPSSGTVASYNVYWSTSPLTSTNFSTNGIMVATGSTATTLTVNSSVISGIQNGTYYYFVVTAVNSANTESAASNLAYGAPVAPPGAPSNLTVALVSGTTNQVKVTWNASSSGTPTAYNVYYSTVSSNLYSASTETVVKGLSTSTTTDTITLPTTSQGLTNYFYVTASNAGGETSCPTTNPGVSVVLPPAAPSGTGVTSVTTSSATLGWTADQGATSYTFTYSTSSAMTSTVTTTATTNSLTLSSLSPGQTYYYVITATNSAGTSGTSAKTSFTTLAATPTSLAVIPTAGTALVTWTASTGAASYNLYYSTSSSVTTSTGTEVSGVTSGYSLTGLTNWTTYYFIVTAVTAGGESVATSAVSAMPYNEVALVNNYSSVGGSIDSDIVQFSSGASTSTWTYSKSSWVTTNPDVYSLAVDANHTTVYTASQVTSSPWYGVGLISGFNNSTGALSGSSDSATESFFGADGLVSVVTPSGYNFLYVGCFGSSGFGGFPLSSSGGLGSPITTTAGITSTVSFSSSTSYRAVVSDPSGSFFFVTDISNSKLRAFTINPTTGYLTEVSGSPYTPGSNPFKMAVGTVGTSEYLYVCNWGSNNISVYLINPSTGVLTSAGTIATASTPTSVAVNSAGSLLFVTSGNGAAVQVFPLASTGLNSASATSYSLPAYANSVALDYTGQCLAVAYGNGGSCGCAVYSVSSTGSLTLMLTIPTGTSPTQVQFVKLK